jgi:hypothetical protein
VSKAGHYIVRIGSLIIIGVILYVVSYRLIITLPQPWIALVLIIALFCCAIPLHSWIVTKLTARKPNNVQ